MDLKVNSIGSVQIAVLFVKSFVDFTKNIVFYSGPF